MKCEKYDEEFQKELISDPSKEQEVDEEAVEVTEEEGTAEEAAPQTRKSKRRRIPTSTSVESELTTCSESSNSERDSDKAEEVTNQTHRPPRKRRVRIKNAVGYNSME